MTVIPGAPLMQLPESAIRRAQQQARQKPASSAWQDEAGIADAVAAREAERERRYAERQGEVPLGPQSAPQPSTDQPDGPPEWWPACAVCRGPVGLIAWSVAPDDGDVTVVARCHGARLTWSLTRKAALAGELAATLFDEAAA